ncbi:MAG: phage tail assembly protein [Bacillota bacterium]
MAEQNERKPVFADVTLEEPIARGETKVETVRLRRPESGELRGLSMVDIVKLEVEAIQELLPRISEPKLTDQEVRHLSAPDLFQLSAEIAGFFLPKGMNPASLAA